MLYEQANWHRSDSVFRASPNYTHSLTEVEQTERDRKALNNILGMAYDHHKMWTSEWQPTAKLLDQWPHAASGAAFVVEARAGNRRVTNTTMGSAEMWVHHCLWTFRESYEGDVFVIDEPEYGLAARGQGNLIAELGRLALARDVQVVVATNSREILARVPIELVRILTPTAAGVRVLEPEDDSQVAFYRNERPELLGIAFVEDVEAAAFLRSLLSILSPGLLASTEIVVANGAANAARLASDLSSVKRVGVVAVLDADQKAGSEPASEQVHFLPGEAGPESELAGACRAQIDDLADALGRSAVQVTIAFDQLRFLHHNKWISSLSVALGVAEDVLRIHMMRIWLRGHLAEEASAAFVIRLREALRRR